MVIKSEDQIKLEVAVKSLDKHLGNLEQELRILDPLAVWNARLMLAAAQGVVLFMKGGDYAA